MQATNVSERIGDATGINSLTDWIRGVLPDAVSDFAGIIVAAAVICIGWAIAKFAAALVSGAINRTGLGKKAKLTGGNIGKSLSKAVFWVLFLVFILLGLKQSGFGGDSLGFADNMLNSIFLYVPKIIGAVIILGIGTILAKVVKEALSSTLEVAQVDNMASRFGFAGADAQPNNNISRSLGGLAGAFVLLLAGGSAIDKLDIETISKPINGLVDSIIAFTPNALIAALIMALTVFIGRFASNMVRNTLPALGVDDSLGAIASLDGTSRPGFVPSKLLGTLTFVGILVMGLTAALAQLKIPQLTDVFETIRNIGGKIIMGSIIIGVGLFIASFVSKIVSQTAGDLAGTIVKYATLILITFMGLSQMDLGNGIVEDAFQYLVMGSAAAFGIGGAIAFGLGGREWAAKKLNKWW